LRDWVRKGDVLVPRGKNRKSGGGKKPLVKFEKEKEIYNWLMDLRSQGAPVTAQILMTHVKDNVKMKDLNKMVHFNVSRSWLDGYFGRWKLSLRKSGFISPLSLVQGTKLESNICSLWKEVFNMRRKYEIKDMNILNLDEVPVWFDAVNNLVIDKVGVDRARVRSNGRDKLRMTMILTICGDGSKLPPLLIFKSLGNNKDVINRLMEKYNGKFYFATSEKAYNNQTIFLWYLNKLFPHKEEHKLLLMDTSNTHGYLQSAMRIVGNIKNFLDSRSVHIGIIPEHCTGLVQPLDTHINKPMKSYLKNLWSNFMVNNIKDVSENGLVLDNLPEARIRLCSFIRKALKSIKKELIIKSFRETGYTLSLDGSEEQECCVYRRTF
jgi:hypothetical protein